MSKHKVKLISINEAASQGVDRLRQSKWQNPLDHIKLDLVSGSVGPWVHLYAPFNLRCNGKDPVDFIGLLNGIKYDTKEWEVYTGPLPDSIEYKTDVARFGEARK